MIQSKIKSLGRRAVLLSALTALMAAAGASAAAAEVIVTPNTEVEWNTEVTVKGTTVPAGADDVTIVLCNASVPKEIGKRCDPASGTGSAFVSESTYTTGISIPVRRGPWDDYSYLTGFPPVKQATKTTCYSELEEAGDPCVVVVSFYDTTEMGPKQIGTQAAPITFE